MSIIHIDWKGPYTYEELINFSNTDDIGVYQVYGSHVIYGSNVLLYIGMTVEQSFHKRLIQEGWNIGDNCSNYRFRLGYLKKDRSRLSAQKNNDIQLAEKLMIFSIRPALNTSNTVCIDDEIFKNLHIINWNELGDIPAEISGLKWTDLYWVERKYLEYRQ